MPPARTLSDGSPAVRLTAFGPPEVLRNGVPVVLQPKALALLTYLALGNRRGVYRRDELIGVFWPDSGSLRARTALRQALHGLRRKLGEDLLVSRGDEEIVLRTESHWCDVREFEALLDGDASAALAVYRGPFLQGFHVKGCGGFERWVETTRHHLACEQARLLEQLAHAAQQRGDPQAAVVWWRRLAAQEPYNERIAAGLVRALLESGDLSGAASHVSAFEQLLQKDLGVSPGGEFRNQIRMPDVASGDTTPIDADSGQADSPTENAQPERKSKPDKRDRATRADRIPKKTLVVASALAVAALSLAVFGPFRRGGRELVENRIAVAPFENRTGDPTLDMLGEFAADRVGKQMQGIERLEFVQTWTTMIAWRMANANTTGADHNPTKVFAHETGAGLVVSGWYYRRGDSLYFHAETTEQPSDRRIGSVGPIGADTGQGSTHRAIDSLGTLLVAQVAFDRDALFNPEWMEAFAHPPRLDAYLAYSRGMEHYSAFRFAPALEQFEHAVSLDSTFIEPLIWAFGSQYNLGNYAAADTLTRLLDRQRDRLSPLLRHMLDEAMALVRGDWNTALKVLRATMKLVPDPTAFELGWVATLLNRPREAIVALETLDPDRGWLTLWLGYWERLTDAYHMAGDYRHELRTALQGLERHHASSALLRHELWARAALGQSEQVRSKLDEARLLQSSFSWLAVTTGLELAAHGRRDPPPADVFAEALGWLADRSPEERVTPDHQRRVAETLYRLGRWDDARRIFDTLVRADTDNITLIGWSGLTAARLRDTVTADSVRRLLATRDDPYGFGRSSYWQARIAAVLGDREGAVALLREALRLGFRGPRSTGYPIVVHREPDFETLRGFPPFDALMKPKG